MHHMRMMAFIFLPLLLCAQHDPPPTPGQTANREHNLKDPVAIAAGAQLYNSSCAGCHGPDGIGGRGPNLVRQLGSHNLKDDELLATIRNGVAGTDMPPTPLSEQD